MTVRLADQEFEFVVDGKGTDNVKRGSRSLVLYCCDVLDGEAQHVGKHNRAEYFQSQSAQS